MGKMIYENGNERGLKENKKERRHINMEETRKTNIKKIYETINSINSKCETKEIFVHCWGHGILW